MWVVVLAIWLPIVVSQLILPSLSDGADPGIWIFFVAGVIALVLFICSGVGVVAAARADVAQGPPSY